MKEQAEQEIAVTFTKEELDYLEFYLRWSDKQLFGNYEVGREERVVVRNISRKARLALAADTLKLKAEITELEKMLGPVEEPPSEPGTAGNLGL